MTKEQKNSKVFYHEIFTLSLAFWRFSKLTLGNSIFERAHFSCRLARTFSKGTTDYRG